MSLTGGSRIADGRAGTPSMGATSPEQTSDRPYATQLDARVRICRKDRSRSLTCSELTRTFANSPATPTRSITRPAWQDSGPGGLSPRVRVSRR